MAGATSNDSVTLEFYGALAERFQPLGIRHGTRTRVSVPVARTVADLLTSLAQSNPVYAHLFDASTRSVPEHVEVVLNDRVLDLQGGVAARLQPGDVVAFVPAHAGG
jgi:molybdopterin converting factor small subunit